MPLSHEEFEALVAVVEAGSFRAAGEKLKKAQSSISYSIKTLEKELAIEIFSRDSYRPKLTEPGSAIYNHAKHILEMHLALFDLAKTLKSGIESKVKVALSNLCPEDHVAALLADFKAKYPQTKLDLVYDANPIDKISADGVDIAVGILEEANGLTKANWETLETIPVCTPNYPAANKDLQSSYFSSLAEISVHGCCSEKWIVSDYNLMKKLILKELGWGYIPKSLMDKELQVGALVKVPSLNSNKLVLSVCKSNSKILGPAADHLWNAFAKA